MLSASLIQLEYASKQGKSQTKVTESISPTQGAVPKRGSPYPELKGPPKRAGVNHPNSRGHTKARVSITPTQGAIPKRGCPFPQLKGPQKCEGVHTPNSRGHTKKLASISPTQGATPKHGSATAQLKGPHQNQGVPHLRRPIVPPIALAKKGVMGGVLRMVKWQFKFAFFHQPGLCRAQISRVSHFWPQYYTS